MMGVSMLCAVLLLVASAVAAWSLHIFQPSIRPPKLQNIHASFPYFIPGAYIWLLIAAILGCFAVPFDQNGGFTGVSRHALMVGFLGTMVFSIGCRQHSATCVSCLVRA